MSKYDAVPIRPGDPFLGVWPYSIPYTDRTYQRNESYTSVSKLNQNVTLTLHSVNGLFAENACFQALLQAGTGVAMQSVAVN